MLTDVSVARGNLVLVDHGQTIAAEIARRVPAPTLFLAPACSADHCAPPAPVADPGALPADSGAGSSDASRNRHIAVCERRYADACCLSIRMRRPSTRWTGICEASIRRLTLTSTLNADTKTWQPQRTLLNSADTATDFVIEVDDDGLAHLRFGDDTHGMRPATGTAFTAGLPHRQRHGRQCRRRIHRAYRGVGRRHRRGDRRAQSTAGGRWCRPGSGGRRPSQRAASVPHAGARRHARGLCGGYRSAMPAFSAQRRRCAGPGAGTPSSSPSTRRLAIDPAPLKAGLRTISSTLSHGRSRSRIQRSASMSRSKSTACLRQAGLFPQRCEGRACSTCSATACCRTAAAALFHPDNFTFGQTVYLSPLYAAAHAVPGVQSVQITTFQRQGIDDPSYLADGRASARPAARSRVSTTILNFPERGVLQLDLNGGQVE